MQISAIILFHSNCTRQTLHPLLSSRQQHGFYSSFQDFPLRLLVQTTSFSKNLRNLENNFRWKWFLSRKTHFSPERFHSKRGQFPPPPPPCEIWQSFSFNLCDKVEMFQLCRVWPPVPNLWIINPPWHWTWEQPVSGAGSYRFVWIESHLYCHNLNFIIQSFTRPPVEVKQMAIKIFLRW